MIKHRIQLDRVMPKRKLTGAEVGVASGLFSNDILMNWKIETIYLIDIWKHMPDEIFDALKPQEWHDFNLESTRRIMANHNKKAIIMQGLSVDMAMKIENESLDFVYLDADHSIEGVMSDLLAWFPKLKPGGIMSGHDYLNESFDVAEAVHEYCVMLPYDVSPVLIPEHNDEEAGFYFIKE